jgi:hypothetical protein
MEATLVLCSLAQRFRLELADADKPIEPWPVVTLRTRDDVMMRVSSR